MAILGIDEAGRGPWAGPLVVGAVILPEVDSLPGTPDLSWLAELTDSKKLTPKRREHLSPLILEYALCGLGWVCAAELDDLGMTKALQLATRRAVKNLKDSGVSSPDQDLEAPNSDSLHPSSQSPNLSRPNLPPTFSEIIIDGTQNFLIDTPLASRVTTVIKADAKIRAVSAASIIAKVARDHYMCELALKYPEYGFEKHKGYGTAIHQTALKDLGPCPEHRFSFAPIRRLTGNQAMATSGAASNHTPTSANPEVSVLTAAYGLAEASSSTTSIGQRAESVVARHLESRGHTIRTRNFRTKAYEIDLISTFNQDIFFTEVKYRKDGTHGDGLEAISPTKQQQMQFAAESFLHTHPEFKAYTPHLAVAAVYGADFKIQDFFALG